MADNSDLQKIQASEKPTSDDFEYAYVETVNKAFVRIAKERLKEILGANRYTNEEIDQKLSTIPKFNIEVVSSLPTTDISETTIYLVSSGDDSENLYTEYININGLWEILGTQKSTFSGSAKDVTYDDTETKLGATNVQDAFGKLSATVNDKATNPTTGKVGQIIAILTVDENGKPTSYQAIDKPSGAEISTEELQEAVNNYLAENPVSGLSVKEKETLLALFKSIEYTGDMSATVKRLEALFAGEEGISYTITYNLTNVTSSDSDNTIVEGSAKTITLTADEGFLLDTVTVTMNGEDITASVYSDGVITITSATGNIVITASAVNADILEPVYLLENTTFDGATTIDTGYKLFDTEKSFTIAMDFDVDTCQNANLFHEYNEAVNMNCGLYMTGGWYAQIKGYLGDALLANVAQGNNAQNIKAIITHEANTLNYTAIYISDGEMVKVTDIGTQNYHNNIIGKTGNLIVGGRFDTGGTTTINYFTGKVNTFAVYERILEESEIVEFMEV